MNKKHIEQPKKCSKLFYLSIVVFLIIGFIAFSIFVNTFSKTGETISIPVAFPIMAIIIFYEGAVSYTHLTLPTN